MELFKLIHVVEDEHVGASNLGSASRSCHKSGVAKLDAGFVSRYIPSKLASLHCMTSSMMQLFAVHAVLKLRSCAWRACILHEEVRECVHAVMFLILLSS